LPPQPSLVSWLLLPSFQGLDGPISVLSICAALVGPPITSDWGAVWITFDSESSFPCFRTPFPCSKTLPPPVDTPNPTVLGCLTARNFRLRFLGLSSCIFALSRKRYVIVVHLPFESRRRPMVIPFGPFVALLPFFV